MNAKLPPLYSRIADQLVTYQAYLVGGAVRDLLLDQPIHDYDFTLAEGSVTAARQVADELGGAFFILDKERETARVILRNEGEERVFVDFTRMQGQDIQADLRARDFTVTSMALDVAGDGKLIDPLKGAQDLKDKVLRASSGTALQDDPLRCLRAVRLAAHFGLRIQPETKKQIRETRERLVDISPERIRDEVFRLLEGPNQTAALQTLEILGLSEYALPCKVSEIQAKTLRNLEDLWELFLREHDQDSAANWSLALLVHRLGRYRDWIRSLLSDEFVPGRSFYQLSFMAVLASDLGGNGRLAACRKKVPLSNVEWDFLIQSAAATGQVQGYLEAGKQLEPLDIYRYYREYDIAGVAGVFLSLASRSVSLSSKDQQEDWIQKLEISRGILEGWWEKADQWVNPPVLFSGFDIQSEFGLTPGPRIGELLESVREAQVSEGYTTREEAQAFLSELLARESGKTG